MLKSDAVADSNNEFCLEKSMVVLSTRLNLEDLQKIENSLSYYEKISLLFLIYGYEDPLKGYEKMLELTRGDKERKSFFLIEWACSRQNNNKWQDIVIEALLILQSFATVKMLGLNVERECLRFLPLNNNCSIYIHRMLKVLYFICENITHQAEKIIKGIGVLSHISEEIIFHENLEIHFLKWINHKIISLGYGDNATNSSGDTNDVKVLLKLLKSLDLFHLYDLLNETEKTLNEMQMNHLNGHSLCNSDSSSINNLVNDADMSLANISIGDHKKLIKSKIQENPEEFYNLDPENMGVCLIIDQKYFEAEPDADFATQKLSKKLETRDGTEKDTERLKTVFGSYGYKIVIQKNLNDVEIKQVIKKYANNISDKDSSFIVCILSHGQQGVIFGTNCKPVKMSSIVKLTRSKVMNRKPSLIFVQACQLPADHNLQHKNLVLDSPKGLQDAHMPEISDHLLFWATVEGFACVRDPERGTWFIQELCNVFERDGEDRELSDLTRIVTQNVSLKKWDDRCMIPKQESTLAKKFQLPQKRRANV